MSFVKRYFDLNTILSCIDNGGSLKKLFHVDAIIFVDKESSDAYEMFKEGKTDEEIKLYLENENNQTQTNG